jgi:hypothetical protein
MPLLDDLRFLMFASLNRRESIENRGRRLMSITWHRAFGHGNRILANSLPKSGTHLLSRCLELMPGIGFSGYFFTYVHHNQVQQSLTSKARALRRVGPGQFVGAHMPFACDDAAVLAELGYRHVVLIRDPRDVLVSQLLFLMRRPTNRFHAYFQAMPDDETRLMALMRGVPDGAVDGLIGLPGSGEEFCRFAAWGQHGALILRFEDLIGEQGGGDRARQLAAIGGLARFIGVDLPETGVACIADQIFDRNANTFRKGAIGDWRNHFTAAHSAAFKAMAGKALIEQGYEDDLAW